jgi:hypothetical protein
MRTTSFAHRLSTLAIIVACTVGWPAARLCHARVTAVTTTTPGNPGAAPTSTPAPATPSEAARYADRERQDGSLAEFEGGARISTTTVIIILLLVIILLILL